MIAAVFPFLFFLGCTARLDAQPPSEPQPPPTLEELVHQYFRSEEREQREKLTQAISENAADDFTKVAQAVRAVQVWDPVNEAPGTFTLSAGGGEPVNVTYQLPEGYDPTQAYPLLVRVWNGPHAPAGVLGPLAATDWYLPSVNPGFIRVYLDRPVGGSFQTTPESKGDLRQVIRGLRRRFHVNTRAIFLHGDDMGGGDAAWITALFHHDLFAGVNAWHGVPSLPYPEQSYPLLLNNLRSLPVSAIRLEINLPGVDYFQNSRQAEHRAILEIAKRNALPIYEPLFSQHPMEWILSVLRQDRDPAAPTAISHWFRYPNQGRVGWLQAVGFPRDLWDQDQLSILPGPDTDADGFITEVLKSKLSFLGGKIEDNTITVETRRCTSILVYVTEEMVDLSKPVVVRCNGIKRHDRIIKPSIPTLLECAYDDWEFQRPVAARLAFTIKADNESTP